MKTRRKGRTIAISVGIGVAVLIAILGLRFRHDLRAWYLLATEFDRLPDNSEGFAEYRHERTGMVFGYVPGGHHTDEAGREVSHPFLISRSLVASDTWLRVMDGYLAKSQSSSFTVSWAKCEEFLRRTVLSFPNEAQREYADRACPKPEAWILADSVNVVNPREESSQVVYSFLELRPVFNLYEVENGEVD